MEYTQHKELTVKIYGREVGTLLDDKGIIRFFYNTRFRANNLEISPIKLNSKKIKASYTNEEYPEIYLQLPGVIRDSLPDTNGEFAMNKHFEANGIDINKITVLDRLAFIGNRGMGALEYEPSEGCDEVLTQAISIGELYEKNKQLRKKETPLKADEVLALMVADNASPVGGAKEKMLICFNKDTKGLMACPLNIENSQDGYEPHLLKFDTDKEETRVEFLYMSLARECGIKVMDFELIPDGTKRHYITKRFDRIDNKKVHIATASALLHKPQIKNSSSYDELLRLVYELTKSIDEVKRFLKQIIFNVIYAVTDDHTKNFSFIMDEKGNWSLSPAYDLIYGKITGALSHRTTIRGKNKAFTAEDIFYLAQNYDISEDDIYEMINDVLYSQTIFKILVKDIGISEATIDAINMEIRERIEKFIS